MPRQFLTLLSLMFVLALAGCSTDTGDGAGGPISSQQDEELSLKVTTTTGGAGIEPQTTITFDLPTAGEYTVVVRNATGYRVKLISGHADAGIVQVAWDARNDDGELIKDGIYLFEITDGENYAYRYRLMCITEDCGGLIDND